MKYKKYCVYELQNPLDNNTTFYVGKATMKTGQTKRWKQHVYEARKWTPTSITGNKLKLIIIQDILSNGLEPIVHVIYQSDVERDALDYEKDLINSYGLLRDNTGQLTNILRDTYLLSINSHANSTKQLISATRISRLESGDIIPTKHTEAHKQKLRDNNPGGKATSKRVHQIDPKTGMVITTHESTRQAGMVLSTKSWRNISDSCNHNKGRIVLGYYWRWDGDSDVINGLLQNIEVLNKKRGGKPVLQIDCNGTIIKQWDNIKEATSHFGCGMSTIGWAIKNNKMTQGYNWELLA